MNKNCRVLRYALVLTALVCISGAGANRFPKRRCTAFGAVQGGFPAGGTGKPSVTLSELLVPYTEEQEESFLVSVAPDLSYHQIILMRRFETSHHITTVARPMLLPGPPEPSLGPCEPGRTLEAAKDRYRGHVVPIMQFYLGETERQEDWTPGYRAELLFGKVFTKLIKVGWISVQRKNPGGDPSTIGSWSFEETRYSVYVLERPKEAKRIIFAPGLAYGVIPLDPFRPGHFLLEIPPQLNSESSSLGKILLSRPFRTGRKLRGWKGESLSIGHGAAFEPGSFGISWNEDLVWRKLAYAEIMTHWGKITREVERGTTYGKPHGVILHTGVDRKGTRMYQGPKGLNFDLGVGFAEIGAEPVRAVYDGRLHTALSQTVPQLEALIGFQRKGWTAEEAEAVRRRNDYVRRLAPYRTVVKK